MKRGDLTHLHPDVKIVGIIDGVMLTDAAVGHREILSLLEKGTIVVGGGSMGALRAAEMSSFGMIGVGKIFEEYASGRVEGDDEVVLAYDPFSLQPLSEPLINIRLNLEKACREDVLTHSNTNILLSEIKRIYYPQRSFDVLLQMASRLLTPEDARKLYIFLEKEAEDFKKKDALFLLNAIKKMTEN